MMPATPVHDIRVSSTPLPVVGKPRVCSLPSGTVAGSWSQWTGPGWRGAEEACDHDPNYISALRIVPTIQQTRTCVRCLLHFCVVAVMLSPVLGTRSRSLQWDFSGTECRQTPLAGSAPWLSRSARVVYVGCGGTPLFVDLFVGGITC